MRKNSGSILGDNCIIFMNFMVRSQILNKVYVIIMQSFSKQYKWWLPIMIMVVLTPFTPWLDLFVSDLFYQGEGHFFSDKWTDFIFNYGVIPAQIVVTMASLVLVFSYASTYLKKWRREALVLILTLAIGSGLIINAGLKDHWGRPRPRQIEEFGGDKLFRPYYKPNFFDESSKSFPSGHSSMGFYFLALVLIGIRLQRRFLIYLGVFLTAILGGILSFGRMAQGGHFLSDILMSALIMWIVALAVDWLVYNPEVSS